MPNWCDCEITIKGESATLQTLIDTVCSISEEADNHLVLDTNKLIPYPEFFKSMDEAQAKWRADHYKGNEKILEDGIPEPKDGYNQGGYQWCISNWGTKWGLCHTQLLKKDNGMLMYGCDTAWSPPEPLMMKLSQLFPDAKITLKWWEGGSGVKGTNKYHKGECIHSATSNYMGHRGG